MNYLYVLTASHIGGGKYAVGYVRAAKNDKTGNHSVVASRSYEIDPATVEDSVKDWFKARPWWISSPDHDTAAFLQAVKTNNFMAVTDFLEERSPLKNAPMRDWAISISSSHVAPSGTPMDAPSVLAMSIAMVDIAQWAAEQLVCARTIHTALVPEVSVNYVAPNTLVVRQMLSAYHKAVDPETIVFERKKLLASVYNVISKRTYDEAGKSGLLGVLAAFAKDNSIKESHMVKCADVDLKVNIAGLNMEARPGVYPRNGRRLLYFDFSRMYPQVVRHCRLYPKSYGYRWLKMFDTFVVSGITAKAERKDLSDYLKLGTNAELGFAQYDDAQFTSIVFTLAQIVMADLLLSLAKECPSLSILQVATDGAIVSYEGDLDTGFLLGYRPPLPRLGREPLRLEHERLSKLFVKDNSNYIYVNERASATRKGVFREWKRTSALTHRSKEQASVSIAVSHLRDGVAPETTARMLHRDYFVVPVFANKTTGQVGVGPRRGNPLAIPKDSSVRVVAVCSGNSLVVDSGDKPIKKSQRDKNPQLFREYIGDSTSVIDKDYGYYLAKARKLIQSVTGDGKQREMF